MMRRVVCFAVRISNDAKEVGSYRAGQMCTRTSHELCRSKSLRSSTLNVLMNWLRVLGTAKPPQIDQGVRHQFHAKMSLLNVLKTQEEPLELVFPRKGPIDAGP